MPTDIITAIKTPEIRYYKKDKIMNIELFLLVLSILFFASIFVSKMSSRLGVPVLLLFLGVGMLFGSDGLGLHFENFRMAQMVSTVALCIILFSGGMDTKISDIRPVLGRGITLATLGVLLMTAFTGVAIWLIADKTPMGERVPSIGIVSALLLAATMSSTDSASVFSILRSKGLNLKHSLKPTLELESGSNDPMAYVLTLTLIDIVLNPAGTNIFMAVLTVLVQLVVGALCGFIIGKGLVWAINKINIDNASLYPILVLASCVFIFALTYYLRGNSYLAVYIGGLVVGNSKLVHKRSTRSFFDGLSWLSQLLMFLTLGLLVNPSELWPVLVPGLVISLIMIFITRPLSVFLSMIPFRQATFRDKAFLSWVGLRGAVPIVFAILCRASDVPHGHEIFNIVFICTLVSLVVQGTSITTVARWLKLDEKSEQKGTADSFDMDLPEGFQSATVEATISQATIDNHGDRLLDYRMPENMSVLMVKRGDQYFVPSGKTKLQLSDCLMIVGDNIDDIQHTVSQLELQQTKAEEPKMITKVIADKIGEQIQKGSEIKKRRKKKK